MAEVDPDAALVRFCVLVRERLSSLEVLTDRPLTDGDWREVERQLAEIESDVLTMLTVVPDYLLPREREVVQQALAGMD